MTAEADTVRLREEEPPFGISSTERVCEGCRLVFILGEPFLCNSCLLDQH